MNITTNLYQITEKTTNVKEVFDSTEFSKITVTIGETETEVDKDDKLIKLLEEANNTTATVEENHLQ